MFKRISGLLLTIVIPAVSLFSFTTFSHLSAATNESTVLIDAVLYDGLEYKEPDEAVRLRNVSGTNVDISNWQLYDGSSKAVIPDGTTLVAGQTIWLTKDSFFFTRQFGFVPDFEVVDSSSAVPNLSGTWPGFANSGDEVILLNAAEDVVDALVYEGGDTSQPGWSGTAVYHYNDNNSLFGEEGQILYRKRDQTSGQPVPDTDTAADWAQEMGDPVNGRKIMYPGWDLDTFFHTAQVTGTAVLTIAIAPDNAYQTIINEINHATTSLDVESHTFENLALKDAFVQAANRGVAINILLEGGPPGGVSDQEKYVCHELEAAGAHCWFMISNDSKYINDRYKYIHAKFILIDGQKVIISSENLSPNSLPYDDKSDGTWGRRGVVLITDAPGVVSHVRQIFSLDFELTHHVDITDTTSFQPPVGFIPNPENGGVTYTVRYPHPVSFSGELTFELVQSPENSLRDQDGLLGLINRAGDGDTILVQQQYEQAYWGVNSNAVNDPNLRLEAYINAARRGATVRLLLDEFFDDSRDGNSNAATCQYVKNIARGEGLDMDCALGNPAGLGIHNKMVLVEVNGRGAIHVGSINGSETSHKANRELALQVQSDAAYAYLADLFNRDWPYRVYLPTAMNNFVGPTNHLVISEILYDSPGANEDAEFIELANPTSNSIDLSNFSLGDAVNPSDFEDVRRFPAGTTMPPRSALVIATTATGFKREFGADPDFEILETDPLVPNLIDDTNWGNTATYLQLGNSGDELLLRNTVDQVIDVVTYGSGSYPVVTSCPLASLIGASLERYPYWQDTNDCTADFQENPFPSPGTLSE